MLIGVPGEIKVHEYRVGLIPASVRELTRRGHAVIVESGAGAGAGATDDDYLAAGAGIVDAADELFARADMIVKVKEPQPAEFPLLREGQVLFAYLHLAAAPAAARALLESGCVAIAYDTVAGADGGLPLLAPMSEVCGRMSIQIGARLLERAHGGAGILLGGVPGTAPARVTVLGGGVAGTGAARVAMGMGAGVTVLDRSLERLRQLDLRFGPQLGTALATVDAVARHVGEADLVVGAVLAPGATAPRLATRETVAAMRPGSAVVDIAIDQGGCFETSRPTTHDDPAFAVDGVVHYCVANIPGVVPRTSARALSNATLPAVCALAGKGWRRALDDDPHLRSGLNVAAGRITCRAAAEALDLDWQRAEDALAQQPSGPAEA